MPKGLLCFLPIGTTMSEQMPQRWEVWHARFDYSEGHGYKYRPVIVVDNHPNGEILAMMVTSTTNKLTMEHDYLIRDWAFAGLTKPSIARADRIAELPPGYLGTVGKIGSISDIDIYGLSAVLGGMVHG